MLANIDFSNGDYALYVKHKSAGEFMVIDEAALKENRSKLSVELSFVNYLPGEGDRSFGVMLFKDSKLISSKIGGAFNHFEIGSLAEHKRAVKMKRHYATKKAMQQKIAQLNKSKKHFMTALPKLNKGDKEFSFRVQFPHIAVPVTRGVDESGYMHIKTVNGTANDQWIQKGEHAFSNVWEQKIAACIQAKVTSNDYDVSFALGSLSNAHLFAIGTHFGDFLKTQDGNTIMLNDYMLYDFSAHIHANEAIAKQLMTLDFSDCMTEAQRNRPQLLAKMEALVKTSTRPHLSVMDSEVGLSDYKDSITISKKLYEQEYQLNWLALE